MVTERFAPSPTGLLHLGHAYSAWTAWQAARRAGGRFLLRMEDLDRSRVRDAFVRGIERDLAWLGIGWDGPVLFQSTRGPAHAEALKRLERLGVLYRCDCTRRDIVHAIAAPQESAAGPDGPVYPGTCRARRLGADRPHAVRLDMARALDFLGGARLTFSEIGAGPGGQTGTITLDADHLISAVGDVVLSRRDGAVAYHLAVVVDDAFQGVTHVTRGRDLFDATAVHRVLQALLDLNVPVYRHHALVRDETGKRLAKRDDARAIARYREAGLTQVQVLDLASAALAFRAP